MRKLFVFLVLSLFIMGGIAFAEQGSTAYSGKNYVEQQLFVDAYNGTAGTLTQNAVVCLDITNFGAAGASFTACGGTIAPGDPRIVSGAAVREIEGGGTNVNSALIFGVVDSTTISSSSVGRICVRGPHLVMIGTAPTLGNLYTTGGVQGKADYMPILGGTAQGWIGVCINTTTTATLAGVGNGACLMWVQPTRSF